MVNNIVIILVQNYCKSKNVNKITNHHFTVTTLLYLYFLWTNMSIYEIHDSRKLCSFFYFLKYFEIVDTIVLRQALDM